MTKFQEREKWEEVNQLMKPERWQLSRAWLDDYNALPAHFVSTLAAYKFAGKMVSNEAHLLEIKFQHGMGIPILSEFCSSYTGLESDLSQSFELKKNLDPHKCNFYGFDGFEEVLNSHLFDSIVMINSEKRFFENYFFKSVDFMLQPDGKALCSIKVNEAEGRSFAQEVLVDFEKRFKLVVPFYLIGGVVQCGTVESPEIIIYLGMQKKD